MTQSEQDSTTSLRSTSHVMSHVPALVDDVPTPNVNVHSMGSNVDMRPPYPGSSPAETRRSPKHHRQWDHDPSRVTNAPTAAETWNDRGTWKRDHKAPSVSPATDEYHKDDSRKTQRHEEPPAHSTRRSTTTTPATERTDKKAQSRSERLSEYDCARATFGATLEGVLNGLQVDLASLNDAVGKFGLEITLAGTCAAAESGLDNYKRANEDLVDKLRGSQHAISRLSKQVSTKDSYLTGLVHELGRTKAQLKSAKMLVQMHEEIQAQQEEEEEELERARSEELLQKMKKCALDPSEVGKGSKGHVESHIADSEDGYTSFLFRGPDGDTGKLTLNLGLLSQIMNGTIA